MRALISYGVAIVILVLIALYMGSGLIVQGGQGPGQGERPAVALIGGDSGEEAEHIIAEGEIDPSETIAERNKDSLGDEAPARSVRIQNFRVTSLPLEAPLRGRTVAKAIVSVVAETSGIVEKISVTKGQKVEAGDLVCSLDKGTRAASVAQAKAGLAQAQLAFDSNQTLLDKGLTPENSKAASEAALRSAEAALDQAQAELDRTEIHTAISGVVQDPIANAGTLLSPGQVCVTVAQLDPMIFKGEVPEARISLAKTGLKATVTTVSGVSAEGTVTYIAPTANDATRSFPVEIQIPNTNGKLLSGLTAQATVNLGTIPAHLVPQSVLTLDDDGELGVRAVKDNVVEFYPVTITSDTRDGVWVLGLPPSVDIITVGQEYVKAGQIVDATSVEEATKS